VGPEAAPYVHDDGIRLGIIGYTCSGGISGMQDAQVRRVGHLGFPARWTPFDETALRAIEMSCVPGQEEVWRDFLRSHPVTDGIAELEGSSAVHALLGSADYERYPLEEQLRRIDVSLRRAYDPALEQDMADTLLLSSASAINKLVADNFLSLVTGGAPPEGHLLYFTARLHRCLVVAYSVLGNGGVDTAIVASIPKPRTVFDVFDNIDVFGPMARNVLKAMLASGHKIIGHRNTFVHVDRRADRGVFGPSIDTLYLNEMLFKYVYEDERLAQPRLDFARFAPSPADYANLNTAASPLFGDVLEIGPGNGLLIASFVKNVAWMDRFAAVDPSLRAIDCTYRATAQQRLYRKRGVGEVKGSYICGRFAPDQIAHPCDIVLCNPPYIPTPPTRQPEPARTTLFGEAVSGTELLAAVLQALPRILTRRGLLFMVYSALADHDVDAALPLSIEFEPLGDPQGFEVPFDVEAVLQDQDWLAWLVSERGLVRRGDVYYHRIRCRAFHIAESEGFDDTWGLLRRIRDRNALLTRLAPEGDIPVIAAGAGDTSSVTASRSTIMLRFRDLVAPTIAEHQRIIDERGYVWWGWWKKPTEIVPGELLRALSERAHQPVGDPPFIYLLDTGRGVLYAAPLLEVASSTRRDIPCPQPMATPDYYRGREYAAWFKLGTFSAEPPATLSRLAYHGFPTLTTPIPMLLGRLIGGPEELRSMDVTLWWVARPMGDATEEGTS